ncbi:AfsR/SARP family transcriptional regulator [Micromonospora sp. NBS 11-29]|uniref:AfsR/SARP family transcriptional regulator n=1 Tax=Micromonospora sp. NBS 11-29 TaxID=1960879 RepID=UPI0020CC9A23|nr:AfsR/SARP family transcriptional regulator [Micromonospora sp. NBS 11-29]
MQLFFIDVLGPISARVAGDPVRLGGPRPKAILVRLLLAEGMVITEDQIIEDVWDGRPPRSARQALHTYVRHLRRAIEPDRAPRQPAVVLRRHANGYSLALAPGQVDAERFSSLASAGAAALAEGEAELAVRQLDEALALWRGAPYADLCTTTFVDSAVRHLETLWAVAREDRVAAGLALGQHRGLLNQTRTLIDDFPLDEHAWELRALALYRAGRHAEALDALRAIRTGLREELGVSPGPRLRALHQLMVARDATLEWRPCGADRKHTA